MPQKGFRAVLPASGYSIRRSVEGIISRFSSPMWLPIIAALSDPASSLTFRSNCHAHPGQTKLNPLTAIRELRTPSTPDRVPRHRPLPTMTGKPVIVKPLPLAGAIGTAERNGPTAFCGYRKRSAAARRQRNIDRVRVSRRGRNLLECVQRPQLGAHWHCQSPDGDAI